MGELVVCLSPYLPLFTNVPPNFDAGIALVLRTSKQLRLAPQRRPLCGLNMAS